MPNISPRAKHFVQGRHIVNMSCAYKSKYQSKTINQGSGSYGSWARCGSFDDGIWLARYFLITIVAEETFSVISLQSHQLHHAAPEVALTVRSMLLRENW